MTDKKRITAGEAIVSESKAVRVPAGQPLPSADPPSIRESSIDRLNIATRGIRISAAYRRSLFDNRPPRVGSRVIFSIDFYNQLTKEPTGVGAIAGIATIDKSSVTIDMVENTNTGRIGHYTGSFVPEQSGYYEFIVKRNNEIVDSATFYVVA